MRLVRSLFSSTEEFQYEAHAGPFSFLARIFCQISDANVLMSRTDAHLKSLGKELWWFQMGAHWSFEGQSCLHFYRQDRDHAVKEWHHPPGFESGAFDEQTALFSGRSLEFQESEDPHCAVPLLIHSKETVAARLVGQWEFPAFAVKRLEGLGLSEFSQKWIANGASLSFDDKDQALQEALLRIGVWKVRLKRKNSQA